MLLDKVLTSSFVAKLDVSTSALISMFPVPVISCPFIVLNSFTISAFVARLLVSGISVVLAYPSNDGISLFKA